MKVRLPSRGTALATAAVFALCASPVAFADSSSSNISYTGPDSNNTIKLNNSENCTVTNTNKLNLNNSANQSARTGDVSVSGNTNAGSDWGSWNPDVWASHGYSYDQWASAMQAHMSAVHSGWGSGNGSSASSGNASNNNSVNVNVGIHNGPACAGAGGFVGNPGFPGVSTPVGSTAAAVLGSSSATSGSGHGGETGGEGGAMGEFHGGSNAAMSNGTSSMSNGGNGPSGGSGGGQGGGSAGGNESNASISKTGPDSNNQITINDSRNTAVVNTTNITSIAKVYQDASSGDVTTSGNTTAGGNGSGDASNGNSGAVGAGVVN